MVKVLLHCGQAAMRLHEVGLERSDGLQELACEGSVRRLSMLDLGHSFVDSGESGSGRFDLRRLIELKSHGGQRWRRRSTMPTRR